MDAWANDLEIPGRHGIVMHVGDSIGPGGIMRAFRNAPVLADVARNVAEVAPDAWVFNYTNPAPIEALAMRAAAPQVKSYALCSCTGHPASPEWLADAGGGRARPRSRCRRWWPASTTAPRCRSCGSRTAPTRCRWCARGRPSRWSSGCSRPTACCPTAGRTGPSSIPQMQRLEAPYSGTAQGVDMRYGIDDPRHGLREGPSGGAGGAGGAAGQPTTRR